ncbi:MAG: hypothetical protein EOR77_30925, partial [Mesorhizobium sp.]
MSKPAAPCLAFSPCGRRWPSPGSCLRQARGEAPLGRMRGAPAWPRQHSVQHPSSVSALRADPPS